jgi:hypothetical protein
VADLRNKMSPVVSYVDLLKLIDSDSISDDNYPEYNIYIENSKILFIFNKLTKKLLIEYDPMITVLLRYRMDMDDIYKLYVCVFHTVLDIQIINVSFLRNKYSFIKLNNNKCKLILNER